MNTKQQLRKTILQFRDALTIAERREKSRRITSRVISCEEFQNADRYLMFSSFRSEVDTTELLRQALRTQKPVYLPRVSGKEMRFYQVASIEELESGYQGILEPKENIQRKFVPLQDKKIFVLVPGAVFDREGGRIGYGGGFYDKFLNHLEGEIPHENLCKLAVAYECQIIENGKILKEFHDVSPDYIITEENKFFIDNLRV